MAVKIINPTDPIDVKQLCCLIYGQPSSRKSSLAQTADEPITLAFDPGIYRAHGRKAAAMFDTWEDVVRFDAKPYKTLVIDTVSMCLAKLAQALIQENPKNGNRNGGLSLPGYGILKERFKAWVESCKSNNQDIVFIAQEKADRVGDESYYCPDIVGGSYNTLMESCDIVGYMHFENGKRVLDFNPTDRWMAKCPPCGWSQFVLPDFSKEPGFLAHLLAEAKASMGRISEASANAAKKLEEWQKLLDQDTCNLETLNKTCLPKLADMPKTDPVRNQAWHLIKQTAEAFDATFNATTKQFEKKGELQ